MFRDGCEQFFGLKVCFFSGKYKKSLSKNLFFGLNQVSELGDWFFQMCRKNFCRCKKCTFPIKMLNLLNSGGFGFFLYAQFFNQVENTQHASVVNCA